MTRNFGFDVSNVFGGGDSFGSVRKGRKNGKKSRKTNDFDCLNCLDEKQDKGFGGFGTPSGLGIDTFSLANPNIDALALGSDFGDQIGSRAGRANGKGGGFLDVVGNQQVRVPSVIGTRVSGRGRARGRKGKVGRPKGSGVVRQQSPLQRASGTKFGSVDDRFSENIIGNVRGVSKRISDFRRKRRESKIKLIEEQRERPALPPPKPEELRQPERPALPPPKESSLRSLPSQTNVQALARLRQEASSRSAT